MYNIIAQDNFTIDYDKENKIKDIIISAFKEHLKFKNHKSI